MRSVLGKRGLLNDDLGLGSLRGKGMADADERDELPGFEDLRPKGKRMLGLAVMIASPCPAISGEALTSTSREWLSPRVRALPSMRPA